MTQQYPVVPAYPFPPGSEPPRPRTSGADLVVSWLAWALLVVFEVVAAIVMLLGGFIALLSCSTSEYADVCSGSAGDVLFATAVALWILMTVATFAAMTIIIVQTVKGGRAWPWSVGALVTVVLATVGWFGYLFAVT